MDYSTNNFQAKKSLGQNFLHAPHIIGKMIHAAGLVDNEGGSAQTTVLEVGPGKGVLTRGLLDTGARVVAVEKDDRAIIFLKEKFAADLQDGRLILHHGDILELNPRDIGLPCGDYVIVANIPYYITGEFMRKFLEVECGPKRMVLMVQKEVAKRIATETLLANGAKNAKTTKESILSISVKAYGKPKYIATVAARHFRPIPKVDSAVIMIDAISKGFFEGTPVTEDAFFKVVRAGFAHKRKVLIKNLEIIIPKEKLLKKWEELGLLVTVRAEDISLSQWKSIASILE